MSIAFYKLIPNFLTLMRLVFLYFGIEFYYDGLMPWFLGFIFLSMLTDYLDGWLARTLRATTKLGSILDPACDRIVTFVMFYFFYKEGLLSRFYFFLLLLRPIAQISAFIIAKFYRFKFYIKPGLPSKLNSLFVFSLIFMFCISLAFGHKNIIQEYVLAWIWLHIAIVGELGFLVYYSWQFWRIIYAQKKGFD